MAKIFRQGVICLIGVVLASVAEAQLPAEDGVTSLSAEIRASCDKVAEKKDRHQRLTIMVEAILAVVHAGDEPARRVDDAAVQCVTNWLSSSDEYSKMYAAMLLARLGCRGTTALPALRSALLTMTPLPEPTGDLDISLGPKASPTDSVLTAIRTLEAEGPCD